LKKLVLLVIATFVPALLTAQIPNSNHVVVVLEENESYSAVIGSPSMPYLNSLASQNALATQYYANVHPSIGNYFMLTAGQLVTNNDSLNTTVNVDNIVRHLLTAGKTWKSYAESLQGGIFCMGVILSYLAQNEI
jgi:acid phosphatase